MENNDISQKTIEIIRKKGIKPMPEYLVAAKKAFFWLVVALSVAIGCIASAACIYLLSNNDWDIYSRFGAAAILRSLPYFWFVFLLVFLLLSRYFYKQTLFGYRYRTTILVSAYIVITFVFGSIAHAAGLGEKIDKSLAGMPIYRGMEKNKAQIWSNPEKGLLAGKIIRLGGEKMDISDFGQKKWEVFRESNARIKAKDIKEGDTVKIMGRRAGEGKFIAEEIRPWAGQGKRFGQMRMR